MSPIIWVAMISFFNEILLGPQVSEPLPVAERMRPDVWTCAICRAS